MCLFNLQIPDDPVSNTPQVLVETEAAEEVKCRYSKSSFEKNCFSAWASTLNMGLINKVDMVCLSPVGYSV